MMNAMSEASKNKIQIHEIMRGRGSRLVGAHRYLLEDFSLLEAHRKSVEKHFRSEIKAIGDRHEAELAALTEEQQREFDMEHIADQYWLMERELPRLQWYAQFLVAYGTAEAILNKLCGIVKGRSNLNVDLKDMHGQGIERAALYLRKVAGVLTPFDHPAWNKVRLLAEIRNVIAHRNGELPVEKKRAGSLFARIQGLEGLTAEANSDAETTTLLVDASFVQYAIAVLHEMLKLIAYYELYPDAKSTGS